MIGVIQSAKRTPYQSLASLLILFFTLFLALFFFTLTSFFYGILDYVETRPQVTVYFDTKTSEEDINAVKEAIKSSGKTTDIVYVSQEDTLEIYRELNADNPLLLEMVTSDILPASLEIYASQPEYLTEIAQFLQKQPGIDEVSFQQNIVERLLTLTKIMRRVSVAILIFLLITTVIVLMTTTAFKIALKKDEIELMQLLGATKWYIRKPYLIEGVVFGGFSATVAFAIFAVIFMYFGSFLNSYLSTVPPLSFLGLTKLGLYIWPPSIGYIVLTYLLVLFFGIIMGLLGTMIASGKYIKS